MTKNISRCCVLALLTAGCVWGGAAFGQAPGFGLSQGRLAFERLKRLAGEWQGTVDDKASGPKATVVYKTTSGGSAVVETQFPGTKHEMVTIYHLEGERLVLTHYCAMGNQPRMGLTDKSTSDDLIFDFIGGANVDPGRDMHMHAMRMQLKGQDELECEWQIFKEGKAGETAKFFLKKKQA